MGNGTHLATWVSRETKERFAVVARDQGLSDSALLKRMIELTLRSVDATSLEQAVEADAQFPALDPPDFAV